MNKIISNEDVINLKKHESKIWSIQPLSNGHLPGPDSMVKWSGILDSALEINSKYEKILDAGCGPSNLSLILSKVFPSINEIYCLDIETISPLLQSNKMCICYKGEFFEKVKNIPDNSLDLIIDGCSVTHFDKNSNYAPNDGCYRLAGEAIRILKKGGFYITCSDFSTTGNKTGEFIDVDSMIESYERGGLKIYGQRPIKHEDVWINDNNYGVVRLVFIKE